MASTPTLHDPCLRIALSPAELATVCVILHRWLDEQSLAGLPPTHGVVRVMGFLPPRRYGTPADPDVIATVETVLTLADGLLWQSSRLR